MRRPVRQRAFHADRPMLTIANNFQWDLSFVNSLSDQGNPKNVSSVSRSLIRLSTAAYFSAYVT